MKSSKNRNMRTHLKTVEDLPKGLHLSINNMARFEQNLRDKGIDDLAKYLEDPVRCSKVMHPQLLKFIWKGLQVAMYQQPDPLLQEKLADKIGNLVFKLHRDKFVIKWFQVGLETLARDWNKLNQYQTDKFFKLFRILLRKVLLYLVKRRWQPATAVVNMLEKTIILPEDQMHDFPVGPKCHLADILMEELAKTQFIDKRMDFKILRKFLVPYMKVLSINREKVYRKSTYEGIFVYLCRQSDAGIAAFADMGGKMIPEDELQRLKEENREYMEKQSRRRKKFKARKLNETEAAMKKLVDQENEMNDASDASDFSDDEFEDEFEKDLSDVEDEDVEAEEDLEKEEEEDEEDNIDEATLEYPEDLDLDPRAGDVNVVLPQLPVDWEELISWVTSVAQLEHHNKTQRSKLQALQRLVTQAAGGVFVSHHPLVEPRRLEETGVDDAMVAQAHARWQEFEAEEVSRFRPGVYDPAEKRRLIIENDRKISKRVQEVLRSEEKQRKVALRQQRQRYEERKLQRRLERLGRQTEAISRGLKGRKERASDKRVGLKRSRVEMEQEQQQKKEKVHRSVTEATQRAFKKTKRTKAE